MTSDIGSPGFYSEDQWQEILSELPGQIDEQERPATASNGVSNYDL